MFSKLLELTGLGLLAWGVALLLGTAAGIIVAGVAILAVGGVTDDAAVGMAFKRGGHWVRYAWYRQLAKENGISVPSFRRPRLPDGWTTCDCGRDPNCPVCGGLGYVPDAEHQENPRSPHPRLRVDPHLAEMATRLARARQERAQLGDRTPALSRHDEGV